MEKDKISINDVITKSVFVQDQRKFVEKMVKLLNENFQPVYDLPDTKYDCTLLNNLTEESATPKSTIEGLLTYDDLEARLKKQIKIETEGQITIRNISKENKTTNDENYFVRTIVLKFFFFT